jgi:two-component system sensor histidine kinase HydH
MFPRSPDKKLWRGVPGWLLIGAAAVLLPLFAFVTVRNVNREREFTTRLLLEKGAALIRSFEAGTRTGMMGMHRGGGFQLQRLLSETAQQPDIAHLMVTDAGGTVIAHSDLDQVGSAHGQGLDLAAAAASRTPQWRVLRQEGAAMVFEVFRKFEPTGPPMGMMRGRLPPGAAEWPAEPPRIIFVGLDMTSIEEARREDVQQAVVMGAILLLLALAGITVLLLAQSHRETRAALSRVRAFSDHVVENVPIGLVAVDGGGRIAVFNEAAGRVLGLAATAAAGRTAAQVLPPELWRQAQALAAARTAGETEIDCTLTDGRAIPLEVGAETLRDENGRVLGRILLFKDLTELRALRGEIARNQRLATVGRLAAGVAHEIRNPLSSIKGFATYFKERYREIPEDSRTATILIQEVDRLNRVVGQLLEFARPVGLAPRPAGLAALIADSIKLAEAQVREKGIRVKVENHSQAEQVTVDADRLSQVLLNLYLNAVEAMAPGGTLGVAVDDLADRAGILIRVTDTGGGIRAEDLPQVFDPYFTTKPTGTGLGLAIVHNIIEAMGGEVAVSSRPGSGTTFTLSVPFAKTR